MTRTCEREGEARVKITQITGKYGFQGINLEDVRNQLLTSRSELRDLRLRAKGRP